MDTKETSETLQATDTTTESVLESDLQMRLRILTQEVECEFVSNSEKVYKNTLKGLIQQDKTLTKQIQCLVDELTQVREAKKALANAFLEGKLESKEAAREAISSVYKPNTQFQIGPSKY